MSKLNALEKASGWWCCGVDALGKRSNAATWARDVKEYLADNAGDHPVYSSQNSKQRDDWQTDTSRL